MDWDDLRYVLAISRDRTLSRAAISLGASHTTVGRRVRALELKLGVRLFDQTPDGFMPTAAGQDIADVAERMEGDVLSLEGRVLGRDARLQGRLRVATMDILFRRYHDAFSSFMVRYPSVELTVTSSDNEVSLTRREADVALRMTSSPPEYLVGRKLGRVDFAVFGSKALIERMGPDAGYDDYPWIHWDERLNMRWLDDWMARRAPNARIAMRVDVSSLVLREVIAAGIGVHFLASFDGDSDPALKRVDPSSRISAETCGCSPCPSSATPTVSAPSWITWTNPRAQAELARQKPNSTTGLPEKIDRRPNAVHDRGADPPPIRWTASVEEAGIEEHAHLVDEEARQKADVVEEPHVSPSSGQREIRVRDPDGYVVVITSEG